MRSKRSFFNPTLYRTSLLRLWPCWAAALLAMVLILPVNMARSCAADVHLHKAVTAAGISRLTFDCTYLAAGGAFVLGILTAVLLSRYLFSARSVQFYHALPIRREGLLLTGAAAGLTMLWAPALLTAAVTAVVELHYGAFDPVSLGQLLLFYGAASLLFFSLGMLCCQLAGMAAAAVGLYAAANFAVMVVYYALAAVVQLFLLGFSSMTMPQLVCWFTPLLRLLSWDKTYAVGDTARLAGECLWGLAIYAAAGAALLAAALLLGRVRRSERAGDLLAVSWLRPVFKVACAVCGGILLGVLTLALYGEDDPSFAQVLFAVVAWSLAAWLAAEMMVRKSVRVFQKRVFLGWGLTAVCLALVLTGLKLDLLGLERRVPDPSEVAAATVSVYDSAQVDPERAVALHEGLLACRSELEDNRWPSVSVHIAYQLKNGAVLARDYRVPVCGDMPASGRLLRDFLSDAAVTMQMSFEGGLTDEAQLNEVTIRDWDQGGETLLDLNHAQSWEVYQALEADIRAGAYTSASKLGTEYDPQTRNVVVQVDYSDLDETGRRTNSHWTEIPLSDRMEHTLAVLERLGLTW